jgi:hypothetical protein
MYKGKEGEEEREGRREEGRERDRERFSYKDTNLIKGATPS